MGTHRRAYLSTAILLTALFAVSDASARYNVPTGAPPSPLFGATDFSQQMMRFEEFGNRDYPAGECIGCTSLPTPASCGEGAEGTALDSFLAQQLSPLATREANDSLPNPWETEIDGCIRPMEQTVLEGRPPGEFFAHQRWSEFPLQTYFQTATTGARGNGGLRDSYQLHGYNAGEFAPGGLYHNTLGVPGYDGTTAGIPVAFHPNFPVQHPDALWTWDGTFPPKLLMARYGVPILFRHHNALPIDPSANYGFGRHTLTTHEHNGHNPAESDGYTQAFFFPGQFFDYRWPMILAGHDSINTGAGDPRAATPNGSGGTIPIPGDWRETMSSHWFHDHMLDFTAQNVYKGVAAAMNYYSAVDRAKEGHACHYADKDNANLCFPSGTALDWGNRDYDVNLLIADKAWDQEGQLFFNIFNLDGFLGDRMTVNWQYKPYMNVRARRYRFRLLNGAVSRYIKVAVVDEAGQRVPYHLISNDGNIMEHAIPFPNAESQDLPTQAIAERYSIIVDFSQFAPGSKIYLVNTMEHKNGKGPENAPVPLASILNGTYFDGVEGSGSFDPAVGAFMEFRVVPYSGTDLSMDPSEYEPGGKKMIPLPGFTADDLATARHRTFEFGRSSGTDNKPWTIKTDGGEGFGMDPHRLSAAPDSGDVEIWHISTGGGWSHPVHIHFEEGQIIWKDTGPIPVWEKWARKDVYRIGPEINSARDMSIALRFREFLGTYMEHCHNTQHEDHAMLLRWDIEEPGQLTVMPTPAPTWEGVLYEDTVTLATYKTGDLDAAAEGPPGDSGAPRCGNRIVETGETCDDGNGVPGDGCDGLCQAEDGAPAPFCGDGTLDAGEECDDGNNSDGDGCSATCEEEAGPAPFCGDGNLDAGEECDDGNNSDGDGCSATCLDEGPVCGNGTVEAGEDCDDGNNVDGDGCSAACIDEGPVCGNGTIEAGETCDDGNIVSGDGCDSMCQEEVEPPIVLETIVVDEDGKVRTSGGPIAEGDRVEADHAAVRCSVRRGAYTCRGNHIETGTVIQILLIEQ